MEAHSKMQVVCVATAAMLPRARVMERSLHRHQPDWELDIALVGSSRHVGDDDEGLRIVSVEEELHLNVEELVARHEPAALVSLLVPRMLLARCRSGSGPVLHLPASAWILGDLDPLAAPVAERGVLLVPRASADPPGDGLEPSARQLAMTGRVASDLMAVDGSAAAESFLCWWIERLDQILGAPDGPTRGHAPQDRYWVHRSLELAPARFWVATLGDPGCNLSVWNLHEHTLEETPNGILVDGQWRLRLMDLSGFEPDRPYRLSAISSRVRMSRMPVLRALGSRYAQELLEAGWRDPNDGLDIGRHLANGIVFDDTMRSLYDVAHALGEDFGDLFSREGTDAFMAWLSGPAPHGGSHGINRYVFHRVVRDRPDVTAAFPNIDQADGPKLAAWCHTSGRREMDFPEELLPPRPALNGEVAGPSASPELVAAPHARNEGVAANGEPPATPDNGGSLGVRLTGYFGHVLGLGAAARAYATALASAGVPLSTVTVSLDHFRPPVELSPEYGRHSYNDVVGEGGHAFELVCVNADELPKFVDRVGEDYFQGPRIGVWGWETNSIPPRWGPAFDLVDEIWVYSRFVAENIGAVSPVPVIPLPPPVEAAPGTSVPLRLGAPDGFLFLYAFDYCSTIQRKNPVGLITAFKRAFAPGEGPRLLIKTINAPLWPLAEEEILWAADQRPDIHVIDRSLTGEEKDGLMVACDCYVSLHRSEGFGLTMAEAMAIGKPVIGTGYSGNVDFMNEGNSFLVDYEMTRVGPDCDPYPADGEWAEPSVEHASALMRRVCDDPDHAARIGTQAREDIARMLSPETTGAAMRRRLQELAAGKPSTPLVPQPR